MAALIRRLAWQGRTPGLKPAGLVARGAAVSVLLGDLARRDEARLQGLRAVAGGGLLCLLGAEGDLPWADGVRYCAPAPDAAGLWLPTTQAPSLAADLVLAEAARRAGHETLLLWPDPELILPLAAAQVVTPQLLTWLAKEFA